MGTYTEDAQKLVNEINRGEYMEGTEINILQRNIERYEATLKSNKGRLGLDRENIDIKDGLNILRDAL